MQNEGEQAQFVGTCCVQGVMGCTMHLRSPIYPLTPGESVSVTCSDPHKVSTRCLKLPTALQTRGYYSCLRS